LNLFVEGSLLMDGENIITIDGKNINPDELSSEELLNFYEQLKQREVKLYEKIVEYQNKYDFLPKINLDELV